MKKYEDVDTCLGDMAEVKGRLGDKSYFNIKVNTLISKYNRMIF